MVDSSLYIHVIVHRIDPSVDLDRLCGAIDQVVAANEVLRTRIVDCDAAGLLQAVVKKGEPVRRSSETDLDRFLEWNKSVKTDLGTPLIRFALVCCSSGDGATKLVTTLHHVMFDFHVMEFLVDDTWSTYQGIAPPIHAPFKGFVEHCAAIDSKEAAVFWRGRFKNGASIFPPLPPHHHQILANEVVARDISLASDKSSTTLPSPALMPAYIEAAWAMTASDYTSNDSVVFGSILSGRGSGQPGGAETTFGPTIATVPVQVDLRRNMTIQQLVKGRVASRRELSTSPFLQYGLRKIRNSSGDAQQASSFQSVLNIVHRAHTAGLGTSGLSLDAAHTEEPPKPYGLVLICAPGEKQVSVKTLFDPAVLARVQVHRILRQLEHRLRQLVTSPPSTLLERLPCLNFGDTLELVDWNSRGPAAGAPVDFCLDSRVFARAAERPEARAVKSWDGDATYAELVTMVDNLAHEILAAHQGAVAAEEPICVILGRSLSLVVSLLAVMRTGGTCVPIDPDLPDGRKETILRQCRAQLILTSPDSLHQEFQRGHLTHAVVLNRTKDATRAHGFPSDMDVNTPSSRAAYILFTSGSTGQPKGVVLEHRSLASSLTAWADVLGWSWSTTVLQFSAPAWDACALEIFGSLLAGACLCIPSDLDRESGLGVYIRSAQVNIAILTPTALRNLAPEDVLPALQTLVSVGEPITRRIFETWSDKLRLFNAWGPCEASIVASMGRLPSDARYPDTVGTPVGCAVWIVDPEDASRLLPIGAMGEMLIDGPGVARGYHLAPELTRSSFIKPPPFVPKRQSGLDCSSHHLYRTGDLARYNADGNIAFGGRRDNQVKVRGQRFELGEVESVLASHQRVSKVVVTTHQARNGSANKELVAVLAFVDDDDQHPARHDIGIRKSPESGKMNRIRLDDESRNQLQAVREFAEGRLPTFMVPAAWLVVSDLPHTPSRKVDRVKIQSFLDTVDMSTARADAVRSNTQAASSRRTMEDDHQALTPPATPAELALQLAWSSIMGIDPSKIGQESSLMQLGGDSITAMQVATRCRKQGFQVSVADLLRKPTLAEAAREVQQTAQETLSTRRLTASDLPLLKLGSGSLEHLHSQLAGLQIAQDNVESIYSCTATQEGMLLAQIREHDYHNRFLTRLTSSDGEISPFRIADAWKAVCKKHSILRTVFTNGLSDQGGFQQVVLREHEPSVSIEQMPADGSTIAQVLALREKQALDPRKPPHHLSLFRESVSVVYAALDISHTIVAARTYQDLWRNLGREYARADRGGRAAVTPGRPFSDYVVWLQGQEQEARQHWKEYLEGIKPCVFPLDPSAASDYRARGPIVPFNNAQQLNSFCQSQGITNAMFMQAAWALVLWKHTGNSTVCFGASRSDQEVLAGVDDTAELLGPCISMLPCKFSLDNPAAMTAMDVLQAARGAASSAMSYSGCYLAELHDDLGLRDSPLFDTAMTVQRAWPADLGGDGGHLAVEIMDGEDPTEFSIVVGVSYSDSGLMIRLAHERAHVSDQLVERIAETFARVIKYMIQTPHEPLVHLDEHSSLPAGSLDLLRQWNAAPPATAAYSNVVSAFRAMARSQGSAPAVCSWDGDLTYSKLDRLSDRLAYKLRVKHGIRSQSVVAFCCIKATSAVVIMLAVWKAGGAFLALDINHPPERRTTILREAEVSLILVNVLDRVATMQSCFPGGAVDLVDLTALERFTPDDADVLDELGSFTIDPHHAGYLVYTSGSTGRPKGIVLEHKGIATTAQEIPRIMGITSRSRILQLSNLVFDFGLLDIILALYSGACVCMPSDAEASGDIAGAVRRTGANYVECTPTYATLFSPQDAPSVRAIVLGGEALRQENLDTWAPHARVMDIYGPAEVALSSGRPVAVSESGAIIQDIGTPVGCRYWVVDPQDHDELVPVGTTGELLIEGPIVARGYVNSPQAMAASFIDAPAWTRHPGLAHMGLGQHRFYKTGDLVTQKAGDSFVYEGRKDTQVKIRGQRIEVGEIEYHLNRQTKGDTKWVVDVFLEGAGQEKTLAAFCQVSSKDAATLAASELGDNVLSAMPKAAEAAAAALRQVLPSYMVPEVFIPLRKFPVVGPMKTDRRALRAMASGLSASDRLSYRLNGRQQHDIGGLAQPNATSDGGLTDIELLLQRTWAALLGVPPQSIGPRDDFFVLGGNSIRAMRLVTALRKSRHRLGVVDVFKHPTLAEMALKISQLAGGRKGGVSQKSASLQAHDFAHLGILAKTRTLLDLSNIEGVSLATDLQALMLAIEHLPDCGTMVATVTLEPLAGPEKKSLDLARMREACEQIVRHHGILRTVFVQNKQSLLQVTLRNPPVKQIHVLSTGETSQHRVSVSSDMLDILPHFELHSDDSRAFCTRLKLTIHHAHYDAVSLGHLLGDLKNAYAGTTIATRHPSFHEWSSYVAKADGVAEGKVFWRKLLNGSMSHPLAPSSNTRQHQAVSDVQQKQHVASFKVPTANLATPNGTPATVLKAAWSCVLSRVLENRDIVFGFVSANRFSGTFPRGSAEQVPGPCINLVPMRASMGDGTNTMATLVAELQNQYRQSLPYHHIGFRSIVKHCTQWPTSRFNSAILFQNHEAMGDSIRLGDTDCAIVGAGQGADSADVWISAVPGMDQTLSIELRFSPVKVPVELCLWISGCFESLLNNLSGLWERRILDIHEEMSRAAGPDPLSPIWYERNTARAEGADPEDVVDRVLQEKHFEYL
ncbi:acetyl-CoA synthetase-like protein [Colletotrichum caudatum]|nr:acetyl-CoA synthetase-like protein [Colletotrichum caudatum]